MEQTTSLKIMFLDSCSTCARIIFSIRTIITLKSLRYLFLNENFEIRKLTRRILKTSGASDSRVNFMCNNMGFLKNMLSSDFFSKTDVLVAVLGSSPENSQKSLPSNVIVLALVFVIGRSMKNKKLPSSDVLVSILFLVWKGLYPGRRPVLRRPGMKLKF